MRDILRKPLPVTGTCHVDGVLRIRLAGSTDGVRHARDTLGMDLEADDDGGWTVLHSAPLGSMLSTA